MIDLDQLRSKLSCRDVAERLGVHVPPKADAECPIHKGKSLRLKHDWWRCFGGCDQGGDVVNLYQFIAHTDFKSAVEALSGWAGMPAHFSADDMRRIEHRRRIEDILRFAADYYTARYQDSPAHSYAQERGIDAEDAQLGYATDSWDGLAAALAAAGISAEQAIEAGLLTARKSGSGHYDTLRHRLVIPAVEAGRVVYLQGRALAGGITDNGDRKFVNIARSEPPLYHVNGALKSGTTPIVTESTTDVLRMSTAGLPAVGTYGAKLSTGQQAQLERYSLLYVAIHQDRAGYAYADTMATALGERVRIVEPPVGHNDWDEALRAGKSWAADDKNSWARWKLRQIPANTDPVLLRSLIQPILDYLVRLDDAAIVATYHAEMRKYFAWSATEARGYEQVVKQARIVRQKSTLDTKRVASDDTGQKIDLRPDVEFVNPAQAYHNGIVYVSRMVTRSERVRDKQGSERAVDTHRPAILTSDRRVLPIPSPQHGDPPGVVLYLDDAHTVALHAPVYQAPTNWSYESVRAHLEGVAPEVTAHDIYDQIMASFRRYVYHADANNYVIDVLWTIGTYFHQLFKAYPYLALAGQKASGKTTLLKLLEHLAFNAHHVVNSSEASLFRSIEATAATILFDEQEGLNSRKAGKEDKSGIMSLLKAGYQQGAVVDRQDPDNPKITQHFRVYSPKAIAAVELLEDILADRAILTYMQPCPEELVINGTIKPQGTMQASEFVGIRDSLYLLLMQQADQVAAIRDQVRSAYINRFGELTLALFAMAAFVDHSRGHGAIVVEQLRVALDSQQERRVERNDLTPERMFRTAIETACEDAEPVGHGQQPHAGNMAQRMPDGSVILDALHIADAFRMQFPSAKESYFRVEWLGKQVAKSAFIRPWSPHLSARKTLYRWERTVDERNDATGIIQPTKKILSVYIARLAPEL